MSYFVISIVLFCYITDSYESIDVIILWYHSLYFVIHESIDVLFCYIIENISWVYWCLILLYHIYESIDRIILFCYIIAYESIDVLFCYIILVYWCLILLYHKWVYTSHIYESIDVLFCYIIALMSYFDINLWSIDVLFCDIAYESIDVLFCYISIDLHPSLLMSYFVIS